MRILDAVYRVTIILHGHPHFPINCIFIKIPIFNFFNISTLRPYFQISDICCIVQRLEVIQTSIFYIRTYLKTDN